MALVARAVQKEFPRDRGRARGVYIVLRPPREVSAGLEREILALEVESDRSPRIVSIRGRFDHPDIAGVVPYELALVREVWSRRSHLNR